MKINRQRKDAKAQRKKDNHIRHKNTQKAQKPFGGSCALCGYLFFSAPLRLCVAYLFLFFLCVTSHAALSFPTADTVFETPRFRVSAPPPGTSEGLEYWGDFCEKALDRLTANDTDSSPSASLPLGPGKVEVRVCLTAEDFEAESGMRPEDTAAAALLDRGSMVLNIHVLRSLSTIERYQVVGHELAHLLLGRVEERNRRPVPAWLHEGLAQLLVGEMPPGRTLRLAWAGVFGRFLPMNRLAAHFPYGGPDAELAYAQSASFTRFVATRGYSFSAPSDFFHALLRDTQASRGMLKDLNDLETVAMLETRWRRESGRALYWFLALTSSTLLWAGVVVLFLVAYMRKRRMEKKVMEDWDEWERME